MKKINKKTGLYCAILCIAVWLGLMIVIVAKLPHKLDTVIMLSWPALPGVIGGLAFYRMDKNECWTVESE